ncbi:SAC3/GANP/Nin1/mts3/eIF-3 p25 family-domain-containing protein [Exophiala viscosa]|uniref:SAC3/GANP/Nin1/mts3/eIF-3 p25 family-domain-containing protein n=1 Tax=Exophiala viscosa TaxID=2486360 RepID=A0AAN6DTD0_9EURO|nr:SAC3/GANP/Nin1/mts3/eIF-3 p25 family-domain-containing protein [Exophiala viscosa]
MSAPSTRGQRGGSSTKGGRDNKSSASRDRRSTRGASSSGRGKGKGAATANLSSNSGDGVLQKIRAETVKKGSENGTTAPGRDRETSTTTASTPSSQGRGRGRGNLSQTFNTPNNGSSKPPSRPASPAPTNHKDFMNAAFARFQELKTRRDGERAKAIRDGFLADPEKKTSLDKAITPVGTCTEMCPEFERVERIVQNMVDKAEKVHNDDTGRDVPSEARMVKRFRRSAAGYDEQLPSDIRTPATLRRTLDYLLDKLIGGDERLATIHKFVWDRTRGIRNDFSIQQVTNVDDVKIAVDCYERIARFHILSLHQLSNPDNLWEGENFDAHQEREQLNNTLLSLLYYYDDNRQRIDFPNEAEFRAYCIIFEFQSQHPDLEDRMQAWPSSLLKDGRVQTALKLYTAAGNALFDQGPLRPTEPFAIAQSNTGSFWNVLSSKAVPYIMACVAEIYFAHVRYAALDALWRSCKSAPAAQQARSRDWSLNEVTAFLGFDTEEETKDFCAAFELYFGTDEKGEEYLDATANAAHSLDQSSIPNLQLFSHTYVEEKRYHRTITSVINGATVAEAIRNGWIEPEEEQETAEEESRDDDQSMFVPEDKPTASPASSVFGSSLNAAASAFTPNFAQSPPITKPAEASTFGQPTGFGQPTSFGTSGFGGFGSPGPFSSSGPAPPPSLFGKKEDSSQQQPQQQAPLSFGGFNQGAGSFGLNRPASSEKTETGGAIKQPEKPASIASTQAQQPAFTGFGGGKTPFLPATTASTTPTSSSTPSAVPAIFGTQPQSKSALPVTNQPIEGSNKPISTTSPFQFPSFSQPAQSATPPEPPVQVQKVQESSTPASSPPKSTFNFQSQASQPPPTPAQSRQPSSSVLPSFTPPSAGFQSSPAPAPTIIPPKLDLFAPKPGAAPSEGFKFPQIQTSAASTTKADVPNAKLTYEPSAHKAPSSKPTIPPQSLPPPPSQPAFTQKDRDRLASDLARIALTRQDGLLRKYIEFTLPDLVKTALNQHRLELHDAAVASIRQRILARKFGAIWRSRAWRNRLNRRAKNRRQLFADTMRAAGAKKKRSEEELEAILQAAQETQKLQEEVKAAAEAKQLKQEQEAIAIGRIAGQKRKILSRQTTEDNSIATNGSPRSVGHKRSKTTSTSSELSISSRGGKPPVPNFRESTTRPQHVSIFAGHSLLGRSTSNQDLRQSAFGQKVDNTHTDYFRLKALGVDPETPIVPYTKETLALRKKREEQERQEVLARARRRPATSAQSSPPAPAVVHAKEAPAETKVPVKNMPKVNTKPAVEDDILKQLREAREALQEQSEWFKQQTVELEKEIGQEEEFRKSQSSRRNSVNLSSSGFARANGYEYLPGETKAGHDLSRTERRIRQTGAHGLATKPLRPSSEYVPVAMSKRSAMMYTGASQSSSPVRKRSYDDDIDPALESATGFAHSSKRARAVSNRAGFAGVDAQAMSRNVAKNPYELLQGVSQDDEEGDDLNEDEEDTEELYDEEQPAGQYPMYPELNGDVDYGEEDEEEEIENEAEGEYDEEEDEGEEGYDDEEDEGQDTEEYEYDAGYPQAQDGDTPLTNPQLSRAASSAPGGSLDDALVLSDSD